MTGSVSPACLAVDVRVRGVVQGVGFRPFVHRLALHHGLEGWVRNESGTVHLRVEGAPPDVRAFLTGLRTAAPTLARIETLETDEIAPFPAGDAFRILPSAGAQDRHVPVPADIALCDACAREIATPGNRRYGYAFTTCTDCGPRYTVIERLPYDRAATSMSAFAQCPACVAEYEDPSDRRHHSQTNACPACGPQLRFVSGDGTVAGAEDAIAAAARALRQGRIVAVRGIGGFHLAVDATAPSAVERLRRRKHRDSKPFAVMVADLSAARALAQASEAAAAILESPARPIVLLPRRPDAGLAEAVAPGLGDVGIMLAYAPVHRMLLAATGPLVMTSGNAGGDVITATNEEALDRLAGIADGFLLHDREIVARCDDSVVREVDGASVLLRRARGFVPRPVPLPVPARDPILAVGPHLKNTFTIAIGAEAHVSPHIGDLESIEALEHFRATLDHFRRLLGVRPQVVVRDLHPGYLSTRIAEDHGASRLVTVQHHHAHIAAVAAEHGVTGPVVGLAFDGTGLGDDGTVWGAEVLVCDLVEYRRVGGLRAAPMPGGDLAARRPWRAALGYLSLHAGHEAAFAHAFDGVDEAEHGIARQQIERAVNAPLASSMGRLFDAAAAVLGIRRTSTYEGQAAMELEALVRGRTATAVALPVAEAEGRRVFDGVPLLAWLGERRAAGADVRQLAAVFHASVAHAGCQAALAACEAASLATVALGGGTFQNAILLSLMTRALEAAGVRVLVPRALGPNDGAISYGQAAVAAALLEREN